MTLSGYAHYRDAFTRGRLVEYERALAILEALGVLLSNTGGDMCWCTMDGFEHTPACLAAREYVKAAMQEQG